MYTVAYENNDIVVRFDRDTTDKETLSRFLEFIELEGIRRKSRLTVEKAMAISKDIKGKAWKKLKPKVIEG
jgi:hypothetical protein